MRTHLTHYLTPAIAAVAAAASIASVNHRAEARWRRDQPAHGSGEERRLDAALRRQNAEWVAGL